MVLRVGVLGIQGGFAEVRDVLQKFEEVTVVDVRSKETLATVEALILPGGESTCVTAIVRSYGLMGPLQDFARAGKPVWGICAGLIILASKALEINEEKAVSEHSSKVGDDEVECLGLLDITVERNAFGRQSQSAQRFLQLTEESKSLGLSNVAHFIRAPKIVIGSNSKAVPLANVGEAVVAVRQGNILGTSFHAEISDDLTWAAYFLAVVAGQRVRDGSGLDDQAGVRPEVVKYWPHCGPHGLPGHTREHDATLAAKEPLFGTISVKRAMPRFLQGGVIMDVVNVAQARVAEQAGACSVMALERIPADIKADGGVARMSDPGMIRQIMGAVSIPVMAKARIGHFAEARVLEAIDVDAIDESEVLTPADEVHHIDKHSFRVPFVCGAKDLGEALRRIAEGAAMIRLKGNAGTGNVMHAVRHSRLLFSQIRQLCSLREDEVCVFAKELRAPLELVQETRRLGRLPVVTFAAGGIATPADVMLMMSMGCDGVFVGSGIFKGENSPARARAMVEACTFWQDASVVARVSENLGKAMVGLLDNGETYNYVEDSKL